MPFQKGVVHKHKPTGRPLGFKGVARQIMAKSNDGADFIDWLFEVWRETKGKYTHDEKVQALDRLLAYGLGRPMQMVELAAHLDVDVARPRVIDALSTLTGEQRAKFREALLIASGDPRPLAQRMMDAARPVIDVDGGDEK
jgi:hypothetical protein